MIRRYSTPFPSTTTNHSSDVDSATSGDTMCYLYADGWPSPDTSVVVISDQFAEFVRTNLTNDTMSTTKVLGLNENSHVFHDHHETEDFLTSISATEPASAVFQPRKTLDEKIIALVRSLTEKMPNYFDTVEAALRCPVKYEEAYNSLIQMEMFAYNRLIFQMQSDLKFQLKAASGQIQTTAMMVEMKEDVLKNKLPSEWIGKSFPTTKSLTSFVTDLVERVDYIRSWYKKGKPPCVFWLGGLFYIKSFFNATMQNHARRKTIPIDQLGWTTQVMKKKKYDSAPRSGIYITGMSFDSCTWDSQKELLIDCPRKQVVSTSTCSSKCPILLMRMIGKEEVVLYPYKCPVYRTRLRRENEQARTSNFVCRVQVPTKKSQSYWEQRGAALVLENLE
jgi:dynein heavy chain